MHKLARYVAYHARLDTRQKDGTVPREYFEGLLSKARADRSPEGRAKLEKLEDTLNGPEIPPALRYLLGWLDGLYGRSGATMDGLAPLSPVVLEAWARLMGVHVLPHEVTALDYLDRVRRNPPKELLDDG